MLLRRPRCSRSNSDEEMRLVKVEEANSTNREPESEEKALALHLLSIRSVD